MILAGTSKIRLFFDAEGQKRYSRNLYYWPNEEGVSTTMIWYSDRQCWRA